MAGLLDLFGGGGGGDEYGDLLTPAQRNAVQARGLLAMAGAFGDAAMPSRLPVPIGAVLGKAAGALGTGQDAAVEAAIQNSLRAQQASELKNKMAMRSLLAPFYQQLMAGNGAGAPSPAPGPGAPSSGDGGAGAGSGGGAPPGFDILRMGSDFASGLSPTAVGIRGQIKPPTAPNGFGVGGDFSAISNPLNLPALPSERGVAGAEDLLAPGNLSGVGGGLAGRALGAAGNYTPTPSNQSLPGIPTGQYFPPQAPYDPAALPDLRRPGGLLDPFGPGVPATDTGGTPTAQRVAGSPYQAIGAPGVRVNSRGQPYSATLENLSPQERANEAAAAAALRARSTTPLQRQIPPGSSGGDEGAPPVDAPEAGGDTAAPDTVVPPSGGGLLALSPDLYRPVEANPFARAAAATPGGGRPGGYTFEQMKALARQAGFDEKDVPMAAALGVIESSGNPNAHNTRGEDSYGLMQINANAWGPQAREALDPLRSFQLAKMIKDKQGWGAWQNSLPGAQRILAQTGEGTQDQVIPAGGGGNLPIMRAQYAPRVPGMPELAPPTPLQAPAGVAATGGKVPGTNLTPQQLMAADALAEMSGLGNPFKGFLESYYKSPGYLEEAAGATARGKVAVEEPSTMRIQQQKAQLDAITKMREQGMMLDANGNVVPIPGHAAIQGMNAGEIAQAQEKAKSQFDLVDAQTRGPNGETLTVKMPRYEYIYRQQHPVGGTGDIVGTPYFTPEQTTSQQKGAEAGWKALEDTHAAEMAANRSDQKIAQMAEAMKYFSPGATVEQKTQLFGLLKDLGLTSAERGDQVSAAETFQRAARQMQISAASTHQGQVSNYERELFASTAPQRINTPESLAAAFNVAQRLNAYDKQIAAIHRDTTVNGVPNLIEAQRRIAALGPPLSPTELSAMEAIREGKVPTPATTIAPAGAIKTPYGIIRPVQ